MQVPDVPTTVHIPAEIPVLYWGTQMGENIQNSSASIKLCNLFFSKSQWVTPLPGIASVSQQHIFPRFPVTPGRAPNHQHWACASCRCAPTSVHFRFGCSPKCNDLRKQMLCYLPWKIFSPSLAILKYCRAAWKTDIQSLFFIHHC